MKKIILAIFLIFFSSKIHSIIYPIEPKYASLKKDRVFARKNASFHAQIKYIYQKKNLPILIVDEHDVWKKIIDIDNHWGWVHTSMISNRKTFINREDQSLFKYKEKNIIKAIVKKGVVGKIIKCEDLICKVKVKSFTGWVQKDYLWGVKKN